MRNLQCLLPTHQPRVSDHMEQIKDMITQIINNDYGYVVEGDVFSAVDKFPNYGQLSGQKLEHNRAGERVAVDSRKRNPAYFALWKSAKPGEPSWDSPWGPGRPGRHVECSAMSAHYLTFKFDIHGGGIDLIFPHHENEIPRAVLHARGAVWVTGYIMDMLLITMSKSLGNFFTIHEISEWYHPLALRHFLLSAHYRSPLNYTTSQLESSSVAVYYIYETLQDCEDALSPFQVGQKEGTEQNCTPVQITPAAQKCISKLHNEFETKMCDDLNTSHILTGAFQDALKLINSSLNLLKKKQEGQQRLSMIQSLIEMKKEVREVLDTLGLLSSHTYSEVLQQLKVKALKRAGLVEEDVLRLIEDITLAKRNRDFEKSDEIRAYLTAKGIAVMDVGKEMIWKPCVKIEQEQPVLLVDEEQRQLPNEQEHKALRSQPKEPPVST